MNYLLGLDGAELFDLANEVLGDYLHPWEWEFDVPTLTLDIGFIELDEMRGHWEWVEIEKQLTDAGYKINEVPFMGGKD
ncbi:MAG: hypothetical protein F6K41_24030 [Symploca sp. SIO3E6]|nr:hypothetical protein [Caldora sp. SIO3E6]